MSETKGEYVPHEPSRTTDEWEPRPSMTASPLTPDWPAIAPTAWQVDDGRGCRRCSDCRWFYIHYYGRSALCDADVKPWPLERDDIANINDYMAKFAEYCRTAETCAEYQPREE